MSRDFIKYTEQALSLLGGDMPDMVYLPPDIRFRKKRFTADGVLTEQELTEAEITKRIVAADPAGFLIAVMNGQPIPAFRVVKRDAPAAVAKSAKEQRSKAGVRHKQADETTQVASLDNGLDVYLDFYTPTISDRERIAQYFLTNIMPIKKILGRATGKGPLSPGQPAKDPYQAMIEKRAGMVDGDDGETS